MLKKIGIGIGVLIGLFVLAAIAVPLFIDVDKFRPDILKAANEQIDGELSLGKLHLSLWTGVSVKIDSVSLKTKDKKSVLETNSASLDIPLMSILSMSPSIIIVLNDPKVDVVKDASGKMNVMTLMKEKPPGQAATPPPQPAQGGKSSMPGFVANASLGLQVNKGVLSYVDEKTATRFKINGLQVNAKNMGLKSTMTLDVELPMSGSTPDAKIDGKVLANAEITPVFADGSVKSASGKIDVEADQLGINFKNGMFEKTAKTPMHFKTSFKGSETQVELISMNAQFQELSIDAKGVIGLTPKMSANMEIHSSKINLASFEHLVPMLKEYGLGGIAQLNVKTSGPVDQLAISGDLGLKGGKAAYPSLLQGPVGFDVQVGFTEKSLKVTSVALNGPGLDMSLKGNVQNFASPTFEFALNSKEINLDKLMKPSEPAKKTADGKGEGAAAAPAKPTAVNPMMGLAKNPTIANAAGTFTANIATLVSKGATISDIAATARLKSLELTVDPASLKAFDGQMNAKFSANLKSPGLNFNTSGGLKGLMVKNALTAFVPKFANTLEGKVSGDWKLAGAAFPSDMSLRSLDGTVNIRAENGRLKTIDMADSIKGIMGKVPFLKNTPPPNIDESFKSMRADLKFNKGTMDANPLEMIGSDRGLDVKGKSHILLTDMTQETYVDVHDPHALLPKEIGNGKDAVLQLKVTGPVAGPKTDYGYTAERLAKNVVKNQAKDAIGKELGKVLGGGNKDKAQDGVNNVLKKLGF